MHKRAAVKARRNREGILVVRNAERTREKLLDAAAEEFASNGIAGARVDKIAHIAGVSKPMIYAYLGDKERLFDAVFEREVLAASDILTFDVDDLPGYAARTYDLFMSRPRLWRLFTWARLGRNMDTLLLPAGQDILRRKEHELAEAQAAGRVADTLAPLELIRLIAVISQMWCWTEPATTEVEHSARRTTIQKAVERLVSTKSLVPQV